MKTKRVMSAMLVICLLVGLCCVPVWAAATDTGSCGDNATWAFDAATGTLTISGSGTAVGIPGDSDQSYGKYRKEILHLVVEEGITEIASFAYGNLYNLKSIRLGNSVKTIEEYAFYDNDQLTAVHLGNGLTSIGSGTFGGCLALTDVVLPASLTHMGGEVFGNCEKLKSIVVPEGITVIDRGTFRASGLTKLYLPASVTLVDYAAFRNCNQLTDIYYGGTQEQWKAINIDDTIDGKGPGNGALFTATVHYNHKHSIDNSSGTQQISCTPKGIKTYTCAGCGITKQEVFSGKHSWDSGKVTAATCTKDGEKVITCTMCKETKKESIAAVGHSWGPGTKNADTTVSYNCKNCSAIKIEGTPVTPTETTVPSTQSNETTAPTVETVPTTDETVPTGTEADAGDPAPKGGFPWGVAIGISLAVLAGGGAGLWFWLKKKQQI